MSIELDANYKYDGRQIIYMKDELMRIKNTIGRRSTRPYSYLMKDEILLQLKELDQKIEDLKETLRPRMKDSAAKLNRKKGIISILAKKKMIDSCSLSKITGLSRTRCNEYLKELERDEIVRSITVGRRKIYKLEEIG